MRLGDLDALKEKVNAFYDELFVGCVSSDLITFAKSVDEMIDNVPTVEAYPFEQVQELVKLNQQFAQEIEDLKRPQGEWIIDGHHIRCNKCNEYICNTDGEGDKIPNNFCPNCGADMRGDKE